MVQGNFVHTAQRAIRSNSTTLLSSLAALGTIATAILAGKASYTSAQVIMRKEESLGREQDPLTLSEKTKLVWTLYIPAVVSGTVTVASIASAAHISANKTAALATAYSISDRAFSEYKAKVVEQLGARKEEKIRDDVAEDRVKNNPPSASQLIISDTSKVLCCELYTGRYFHSDMETIRKAQNDINSIVVNELYATLNDFYDLVDLGRTAVSETMGWNSDKLLELKFTSVLAKDSVPCLAFDYNYLKQV